MSSLFPLWGVYILHIALAEYVVKRLVGYDTSVHEVFIQGKNYELEGEGGGSVFKYVHTDVIEWVI